MRLSHLARIIVGAALLALPASARAQLVVFTDLAAFLGASSNVATDNYDLLPEGFAGFSTARSVGAFSYTASTGFSGLYVVQPTAGAALAVNDGPDVLTFSGFSSNVRAVGGFFFGTNPLGAFRTPTTLTFSASNANGSIVQTMTSSSLTNFFGIVSALPIASLTVAAEQPTSGTNFAYATVDNLLLGSAASPPTNVVPEPSTYALLAAGLAALALVHKRRRSA